VRTRLWLLVLLAACGGQEGEDARDTVHPGEPTVRSRRVLPDSTTSDIAFLQYMSEHEWTISDLLRRAEGHDLANGARAALKHAEKHSFENEANIVAARQGYGGGRRSPEPPPREPGDGLEQFQGPEYEGALVGKLVGHYREEVAAIDSALPRLRAVHIRSLAERIRNQRLHDIRELTQKTPK
jgi:hypothetical protein